MFLSGSFNSKEYKDMRRDRNGTAGDIILNFTIAIGRLHIMDSRFGTFTYNQIDQIQDEWVLHVEGCRMNDRLRRYWDYDNGLEYNKE